LERRAGNPGFDPIIGQAAGVARARWTSPIPNYPAGNRQTTLENAEPVCGFDRRGLLFYAVALGACARSDLISRKTRPIDTSLRRHFPGSRARKAFMPAVSRPTSPIEHQRALQDRRGVRVALADALHEDTGRSSMPALSADSTIAARQHLARLHG